jgi:hypothetical protein
MCHRQNRSIRGSCSHDLQGLRRDSDFATILRRFRDYFATILRRRLLRLGTVWTDGGAAATLPNEGPPSQTKRRW